ncbi:hypothetical protein Tco_0436198, partial [Tanacetum coccineum]
PYVLSEIKIQGQPATDDSLALPERTVLETFENMFAQNRAHYDAKAKAIHLILTGIGDDIYSIVDACKTARDILLQEMESTESYYSRFHKMMNEMYQKLVNEICAEKIARNANPHALVAATQQYPDTYYHALKSHKSYAPTSKQSSSTRSHATTQNKGKEIAKPITPPFELVMRSLRWLLEEIHVTWAQLEKKRTRPRLYTNYLEENLTDRGDGVAN